MSGQPIGDGADNHHAPPDDHDQAQASHNQVGQNRRDDMCPRARIVIE